MPMKKGSLSASECSSKIKIVRSGTEQATHDHDIKNESELQQYRHQLFLTLVLLRSITTNFRATAAATSRQCGRMRQY